MSSPFSLSTAVPLPLSPSLAHHVAYGVARAASYTTQHDTPGAKVARHAVRVEEAEMAGGEEGVRTLLSEWKPETRLFDASLPGGGGTRAMRTKEEAGTRGVSHCTVLSCVAECCPPDLALALSSLNPNSNSNVT